LVGVLAQQVGADPTLLLVQDAMRYMITDDPCAALAPLVAGAKRHRSGQPPTVPDRTFFEGLLYLAHTGVAWRNLPAEFGRWDAVYKRFRRWVAFGGLRRLFEAMTAEPDLGDFRRVLIDSIIVRAHQHAAGTRRSAAAQALGRSRGGLTTKVIVTAADEDTAIAVDVLHGHAHNAPHLVRMLDRALDRVPEVDEVVGDKGFDGNQLRCDCIDLDVNPNIPLKANRLGPLQRGGKSGQQPDGRRSVTTAFGVKGHA
jgi:putative transposase